MDYRPSLGQDSWIFANLTEQACLSKDLLFEKTEHYFLAGHSEYTRDSAILPARVANHSAGFDSSGLLTERTI